MPVVHGKRHAVVDVGLDESGDDIGRRRCLATMRWDAISAPELGDTDDGGLHVLARHHHEVGELVDDDDEIGHVLGGVVHLPVLPAIGRSVCT